MSLSSGPRVTRPLLSPPGKANPGGTSKLSTPNLTGPLFPSSTSTRMRTVIPAEVKRPRVSEPLKKPRLRPRKRLAWILVASAGSLAVILALVFTVPLGNGQQKSFTLAQQINNLISTGQLNGVDPAQHNNIPTDIVTTCGGTDLWGTCAAEKLPNGTVGSGDMQPPIKGAVISQAFGLPEYQSWCGCVKPHSGIDLAAPYGTPVTAVDDGQVIWAGWDWSGLGWAVKISHGNFIATVYGHMADYTVDVGQYVKKGQVVGHEGSTGASTGPHLHFMVLIHNAWYDPQNYITLP